MILYIGILFIFVLNWFLGSQGMIRPISRGIFPTSKTLTGSLSNEERLQKVIAHAGFSSRREAEELIANGKVFVNGQRTIEAGTKVNPRKDKIFVNGKLLTIPNKDTTFWIMLNKPKETITTLSDEKNRDTVMKWLPKSYENIRFVPVGRLDRDTSGLLIFTNDLSWIHPLTHPSYEHKHKYEITIDGLLYEQDYKSIKAGRHPKTGVPIPYPIPILEYLDYDKRAKHARLSVTCNNIESKYMFDIFDFVGLPILGTKHVEFGPIKLHKLKIGEWRELTLPEIHQLKHSCKVIEKTQSAKKRDELKNELLSSDEHVSDIEPHVPDKQLVRVDKHKNENTFSSKKLPDNKIIAVKNNNNKGKLFIQKKTIEKANEKSNHQTKKSLFHKITPKKTFFQKKSFHK